jgi:hypothetical protein
MTKRTPLESFQIAQKKFVAAREAALAAARKDKENMRVAMAAPNLSLVERLKMFKKLQAWPRIVLGLYDAELAVAQKNRKASGLPEYGREEPSEIAYGVVGHALALSSERIRRLCKEGRRHLRDGMPPQLEIRADTFIKQLAAGRLAALSGPSSRPTWFNPRIRRG